MLANIDCVVIEDFFLVGVFCLTYTWESELRTWLTWLLNDLQLDFRFALESKSLSFDGPDCTAFGVA